MTARDLQTAIMEDLDQLFKDSLYKTPDHTLAALKTHRQRINQRDAQDTEDPFPYIIVRLDSGGIDTVTDPHKVNVLLLIGIYDDALGDYRDPPPEDGGWDTRNFGDLAVLEIIERIQAHYEKQPHLEGGAFTFDGPFHWVLQEQGSYPYYYGGCELAFTLAAPRRERSQYT